MLRHPNASKLVDLHCRLPGPLHSAVVARAAEAGTTLATELISLLTAGLEARNDDRGQRELRYLLLAHSQLLNELLSLLMLDEPAAVRRVISQAYQKATERLDTPLLGEKANGQRK